MSAPGDGVRRFFVGAGLLLLLACPMTRVYQEPPADSYETVSMSLTVDGQASEIQGARVGPAFLGSSGVQALLGRTFLEGEFGRTDRRVVLLSEGLWRDSLGGSPYWIGKPVELDGVEHTVVGVLPAGFDFPPGAELWIPRVDAEGIPAEKGPPGAEPR